MPFRLMLSETCSVLPRGRSMIASRPPSQSVVNPFSPPRRLRSKRMRIQLPMGHVRPVSNFFVTVAETGARKSASDTEATWPIRKREQALGETRDAKLPNYVNDKTAWEKARDDAVKRGKGNRATIKAALDALGPAPVSPLEPLMTCPEPTFEELSKLFAVGQPSLGIFATEGGNS